MELLVLALQVVHAVIVLRTKLCRSHVEALVNHIRVERSSHGNRLREDGDVPHVGSAVQSFAPPKELFDAEPRNGRTFVEHQLGFLLER